MRSLTIAVAVLASVLVACASGDDATVDVSAPPSTVGDRTTTTGGQQPTPPSSTTTTPTATSTTAGPSTTTTWRGAAVELFAAQGDVLGVVGVAHDDVLNVRAGPGVEHAIVTTLAPLADDVIATGEAWQIPGAFWYEVEAGGVTGWVNMRFVAYLGVVDDATAEIVGMLGATPKAETMLDLAEAVAAPLLSEEPPTRVVVSNGPTVGDLGEVTVDLIGFGDDALGGYRLHVFGQPDGEGFTLKSVERTALCTRGLVDDLCA